MKSIFYYYGEESYLVDDALKAKIEEIQNNTSHETEVIYIDADNMKPQNWAVDLEFSSLFQISRIVIIRNPSWLSKDTKRIRDEKIIVNIFEKYISNIPEGQILIITSKDKPQSNPIVKILGNIPEYKEFKPLNPIQKESFITEKMKEYHCSPESKAIVNRLANSGQDLYYLNNLIQKLALISSDGIIHMKTLDNQVEYRQETTIFKLIDAVLERRSDIAVNVFHQLQNQGLSEIQILYTLNSQFQRYAQIKALFEENKNEKKIQSDLGLNDKQSFMIKKMIGYARRYQWDEIEQNFRLLLDADVALKSTTMDPSLIMEILLVSMTDLSLKCQLRDVFSEESKYD